jgi:hypothetical protein
MATPAAAIAQTAEAIRNRAVVIILGFLLDCFGLRDSPARSPRWRG